MMPVDVSNRVSAESPLARLLGESALQPHRIQVPAKAALYQASDPARSVYYIHQGQIRTYQTGPNGSRRLVEILGADEWCGAAALARMKNYGEVAEAVVPTTVSIISDERLFAFLAQEPAIAIELIHQLAAKLAAYREDASGLVFEDCNHRLIRTLVHLSDSPAASPAPDGVVVRITHQQLAQKVGVARETISLALAQLRRRNLLRTGRNQLTFSPETLRQWSTNGNGHDEAAAPAPAETPAHHEEEVSATH
ncbi:MAG: Crp/Fnr family transcriptional regulator [Bacillota bacterium]